MRGSVAMLERVKRRIKTHTERLANATVAPIVNKAQARHVLGIARTRLDGLTIKTVAGYKVAHRPGTSDEEVIAHSFDNDIFFAGVPEYQVKAGDVILDVGAHIGDFALLAAHLVGPGKVFAVEPCRATFELLELNIELNRATNVVTTRLALGDRDGICRLYHSPPGEDWGNSTTHDYAETSEEVPCRRLATFFEEHGITRVDFAKLNCEGGEFGIILGATPAVLRRIDTMLVLYHCDFASGHSEFELVDHLARAGFASTIRERSAERGWLIATRQARLSDET